MKSDSFNEFLKQRGPMSISSDRTEHTYHNSLMYFCHNIQDHGQKVSRPTNVAFKVVNSLRTRVVSSEISGNFPRKISGNLFQSFRKFPEIC